MDQIKKIEAILEGIRKKHGNACTFTIQCYGEQIQYNTYIADDLFPSHRTYSDFNDAVSRFEDFIEIENMCAYSSEIAAIRLQDLHSKKEDIEDSIEDVKRFLNNKP